MRLREMTIACLLFVAALLTTYVAEAQKLKAVFVRQGEIFTLDADGKAVQITSDGLHKEDPLWSKDGSRIAYLQGVDKNLALAELVVVSGVGSKLADVLIRPVRADQGDDMRFIETLQWLTPEKIAASGSINPSTEESLVLDLASGQEVMNYYDDSGGTVYSPDGEHAAYVDGAPHFAARDETEPALNIDLRRVYPAAGVQVDFLSQAAWSPDGTAVAILAKSRASRALSLVVCRVDSGCSQAPLRAASADGEFTLGWSADALTVTAGSATWSVQTGSADLSPEAIRRASAPPLPDLKQRADALVNDLRQKILDAGGVSPDFWCANCILSTLPRKTGGE